MHASPILRGRLFGVTLLTLVFLTFFGHIASVHSPFAGSATAHEPSEGNSGASHVASCDATLSSPATSFSSTGDDALWMAGPVLAVAPPQPTTVTSATGRPSRATAGPPLFLLHASFLI